MILAIDTSAGQCAVALDTGSGVVTRRESMTKGHAERLFPMIEAVLAEAGAAPGDLTRIAVVTGPGSFTGVRVGLSAARGLALGVGCPVIGVSRFEALAAEALGRETEGQPVAVALAGRQDTVWLQLFDASGEPSGAPEIATRSAVEAAIPALAVRVGDAGLPAAVLADGLADPAVVARIAGRRAAPPDGALPQPLYLRGPDADLPREGPPAILDA